MSRVFISAAAILLLCAVATQARVLVEEEDSAGRVLLQAGLDCARLVHRGCLTCRNQRIKGTKKTETVCSTAKPGWRVVKNNNKACECGPGLFLNGTLAAGTCVSCTLGSYCPGGNGQKNQNQATDLGEALACDTGLETKFTGAKSIAQCFTKPGYGRKSVKQGNGVVRYEGVPCPVATYNVGGNTAGCQKCGAGLTTNSTRAEATSRCLAPAGSYLDKGVGKKCPKGTYTEGLNTLSVCVPCADGVTTEREGSDSATLCNRAIKGYKMFNATAAEKCELDHYNDVENTGTTCKVCPFGWKTQDVGADGLALCLAPPGFHQATVNATITECAEGFYKDGWNRNPCLECGLNIVTNATGSVSKDACLVKPGYGLTQLTPSMVASPCIANSYGDDVYRVAVASARCTACPPNMFTSDKWNASAAPADGYTSETACWVDAGFGMTETGVEQCQIGFYNPGQNRAFCTACDAGYTTLDVQSDADTDCVIKKGWFYDSTKALPAPCDKGTFSTGGDATTREPLNCTACATGYSTQEQEAEAEAECAVCAAGYGQVPSTTADTCNRCPVNTFSSGGLAVGLACTPCADGTVSSRQATESSQCYPEFLDLTRDYFISSDNTSFADDPTATDAPTCQTNCAALAGCIQIRIASGTTFGCQRMVVDGTGSKDVSFKVKGGIDFARYKIGSAVNLGTAIPGGAGFTTLVTCENACKDNGNCEGVMFEGTTCTLITSDLDADYTGFVHITGNVLRSYA